MLSDVIMVVVITGKTTTNNILWYGSELNGPKSILVTMKYNSVV